jgi:hypothetical protein
MIGQIGEMFRLFLCGECSVTAQTKFSPEEEEGNI